MRMRFAPICLIALWLCAGLLAGGCDAQGNAPKVVEPVAAGEKPKQNLKAQGGGVDDMRLIPAPAGVKTGIEGGRK